jgi:hypothetical protein
MCPDTIPYIEAANRPPKECETSKTILAVLVALILSSGIAHADSDDTDFLNALHKQGFSDSDGDRGLIKLGHMICNLLGDGYSENALIGMGDLHGTKMSPDDVKVLVKSSEAAYCPEYIR